MSNICNPNTNAVTVNVDFLESILPSRDSYKTRGLTDEIHLLRGYAGGIDGSLDRVRDIHGTWTGSSVEILAFVNNLFEGSSEFNDIIGELRTRVGELQGLSANLDGVEGVVGGDNLSNVSAALLREYRKRLIAISPDGLSNRLIGGEENMPSFTQISESLGSTYHNFYLADNSTDLVEGLIQDAIDSSGLSSVLSKHCWIRLLPEYADLFHSNIQKFNILAARILPRCTYGKIFNKMDEPLAHIYNLAGDVLGFINILNNRVKYLSILFQQYGDLLRLIDNIYPLCHNYTLTNTPEPINLVGESLGVDILGNKIRVTNTNNNSPEIQ